jgi:integrase
MGKSQKLTLTAKTLDAIAAGKLAFSGRIFGGGGLFAEVSPKGTISFALKYRRDGKERRHGLGKWPAVTLDDARLKAANFDREAVQRPGARTFGEAVDDWLKLHRRRLADRTVTQIERYLDACKADFGDVELRRVKPSDVLKVLRKFEARDAFESAKRTRIYCHKVFAWATDPDDPFPNPAGLAMLKDKLMEAPTPEHHAAMPVAEIPDFMATLSADNTHPSIRGALAFVILTAMRTGEVLGLRWTDIKKDWSELTIPAERMKARRPHTVFLSRQARDVLAAIKPFSGGREYVFPGRDPTEPLSNMAMLTYMNRKTNGYTVHGFRSTFSDWAHKRSGGRAPAHVVELCLAHAIADKVKAAYLRDTFDEERAELWQRWADAVCPKP